MVISPGNLPGVLASTRAPVPGTGLSVSGGPPQCDPSLSKSNKTSGRQRAGAGGHRSWGAAGGAGASAVNFGPGRAPRAARAPPTRPAQAGARARDDGPTPSDHDDRTLLPAPSACWRGPGPCRCPVAAYCQIRAPGPRPWEERHPPLEAPEPPACTARSQAAETAAWGPAARIAADGPAEGDRAGRRGTQLTRTLRGLALRLAPSGVGRRG